MINQSLSIKAVNKYKNGSETKGKREITELDFGIKILCEEYLDVYETILSEIVNTTRFDWNLDLSTTYLGKSDTIRKDKLKVEGKLLDGTECQLLLDTGASKSFMSKSFSMQCRSIHSYLSYQLL